VVLREYIFGKKDEDIKSTGKIGVAFQVSGIVIQDSEASVLRFLWFLLLLCTTLLYQPPS